MDTLFTDLTVAEQENLSGGILNFVGQLNFNNNTQIPVAVGLGGDARTSATNNTTQRNRSDIRDRLNIRLLTGG